MKMVSFLLIAVLLVVAVSGCAGTINGFGRDLEGTGQAIREVSQPGVDEQTETRLSGAYGEWQKRSGVVRDDR